MKNFLWGGPKTTIQWRIQGLTDEGRGCTDFCNNLYTLYPALIRSKVSRTILKSKASNDAFLTIFCPKYGVFGFRNPKPFWIQRYIMKLMQCFFFTFSWHVICILKPWNKMTMTQRILPITLKALKYVLHKPWNHHKCFC